MDGPDRKPKLPDPPHFQRPTGGSSRAMTETDIAAAQLRAAENYLAVREWMEYDLDCMATLGVITEDQADRVQFRQVTPLIMPCIAVMPADVWEALAEWQQKPHRVSDSREPRFHEALAVQARLFHPYDSALVERHLTDAKSCRDEPPSEKPTDAVRLESGRDHVDDAHSEPTAGSIKLQSDDERETASAVGKARKFVRRVVSSY